MKTLQKARPNANECVMSNTIISSVYYEERNTLGKEVALFFDPLYSSMQKRQLIYSWLNKPFSPCVIKSWEAWSKEDISGTSRLCECRAIIHAEAQRRKHGFNSSNSSFHCSGAFCSWSMKRKALRCKIVISKWELLLFCCFFLLLIGLYDWIGIYFKKNSYCWLFGFYEWVKKGNFCLV